MNRLVRIQLRMVYDNLDREGYLDPICYTNLGSIEEDKALILIALFKQLLEPKADGC